MKAIILQPSKTPTQSGKGSEKWVLEFARDPSQRRIESHMGWTSSSDTNTQIHIKFDTLEEAKSFAEQNNLSYEIITANSRARTKKNYSSNFLRNRL